MTERLRAWAKARGYEVGWGPIDIVESARSELITRRATGELDGSFFDHNLASLGATGRTWETAASVVVVVMPRSAHTVTFELPGRSLRAVLPPTYVRYSRLFDEVGRDLAAHGLPSGSRVEVLLAPLKAIAARLGLVLYGRNNVTYARDAGSYHQLLGFVTGTPLPLPDGWRPREAELLPTCESCDACGNACPTGAIGADRVLLRAQRCLTLINENPGAWPTWVPASAHQCLVGCLACQEVCPHNPALPVTDTGVRFSEEETAAILGGAPEPGMPVWDSIRAKLAALGRLDDAPVVGRNLRALIDAAA